MIFVYYISVEYSRHHEFSDTEFFFQGAPNLQEIYPRNFCQFKHFWICLRCVAEEGFWTFCMSLFWNFPLGGHKLALEVSLILLWNLLNSSREHDIYLWKIYSRWNVNSSFPYLLRQAGTFLGLLKINQDIQLKCFIDFAGLRIWFICCPCHGAF